jgi:hypothetical protein
MSEAEARSVLDVYLADRKLLAELRFWMAGYLGEVTFMAVTRYTTPA